MQIVHPSSYTDSFAVRAQDLILKTFYIRYYCFGNNLAFYQDLKGGSMIFEVEHISCKLLKLNPEIVIKLFYIIFWKVVSALKIVGKDVGMCLYFLVL